MSDVAASRFTKVQRQHLIGRLLADHEVTSQEQLVALLAEAGCGAAQATVSRDLDDLGAIKIRAGSTEAIYAIPEHPFDQRAPGNHLRRVLVDWAVDIDHSRDLVVIRTPPGTANVVGAALDRSGRDDILGTVAGDDTLLVIAREPTTGADLAAALRAIAEL